jgi:hypothetical protein
MAIAAVLRQDSSKRLDPLPLPLLAQMSEVLDERRPALVSMLQRQSKGLVWLKPAGTERAPALVREPQDRSRDTCTMHDVALWLSAGFWPGTAHRVTLRRQSGCLPGQADDV